MTNTKTRSRRKFTAEFKAKVAMEALQKKLSPEARKNASRWFPRRDYVELLKDNGIAISMDSRGRALDDIFIERLWRSVKQEYVYMNPCET